MSTKDDQILEFLRFYGAQTEHESVRVRQQLLNEAAGLITKLRAERDAAVLAERERCKKSVRNTICNMNWPPEDGDRLIDDLQTGIALFATDGGTNGGKN